MPRIAYIDGRYQSVADPAISIEDRGYQFADGVYEVIALRGGRLLDDEAHFERLAFSLDELSIPMPMPLDALRHVVRETIRRNRLKDGMVYMQITRGVSRREHAYPDGMKPVLVVMAYALDAARRRQVAEEGIEVATVPDRRWARCDIKSIALLPNILARREAQAGGANEAWQVDESGHITEGTATNAWIVDAEGRLRTHPVGAKILNGITRRVVCDLAAEMGLEVLEKPFTPAEAQAARECFATASTLTILPVVRIDGAVIGNGAPGQIAHALSKRYDEINS